MCVHVFLMHALMIAPPDIADAPAAFACAQMQIGRKTQARGSHPTAGLRCTILWL